MSCAGCACGRCQAGGHSGLAGGSPVQGTVQVDGGDWACLPPANRCKGAWLLLCCIKLSCSGCLGCSPSTGSACPLTIWGHQGRYTNSSLKLSLHAEQHDMAALPGCSPLCGGQSNTSCQAGILCRFAQSRRPCSCDWLPCASVGRAQGGGPASVCTSWVWARAAASHCLTPCASASFPCPFKNVKLALLDGGATS